MRIAAAGTIPTEARGFYPALVRGASLGPAAGGRGAGSLSAARRPWNYFNHKAISRPAGADHPAPHGDEPEAAPVTAGADQLSA